MVPKERYDAGIEQGSHDFSLRVGVNKLEECERMSKEFNEPIYGTLFYPHGDGKVSKDIIRLSNTNIVISALKRRNDGTYLIRLYSGSFHNDSTVLEMKGVKKNINFHKFEFKTFIFDNDKIVEVDDAALY